MVTPQSQWVNSDLQSKSFSDYSLCPRLSVFTYAVTCNYPKSFVMILSCSEELCKMIKFTQLEIDCLDSNALFLTESSFLKLYSLKRKKNLEKTQSNRILKDGNDNAAEKQSERGQLDLTK
jgi:hypothetical protein